MESLTINGLVVRETAVGEADKILSILTGEYGKISVSAKGSKSLKSRHMPAAQLFAYSSFTLNRRGEYYYIMDSELIEAFFNIRSDMTNLALANYICDIASSVTVENIESVDILRLLLNTLYAMSKQNHSSTIVKGAFELKIATLSGFTPDLIACSKCSAYISNIMYLDIMNGILICDKCQSENFMYLSCSQNIIFNNLPNEINENNEYSTDMIDRSFKIVIPISQAIIYAMRFVVFAKLEKFLSFTLDESEYLNFGEVCEKYLLNHLGHGFYSLTFYKSII